MNTPVEQGVTSAAPETPNAGGQGGDDGVLMLDEAMLVALPAAEHGAAPAVVPAAAQVMPVTAPIPNLQPEHGGLMGSDSAAAAAASVGSLLRKLSSERATQVHRGGPTIEDLVREEIRPLLKVWLDLHLPPLVERVVRQEIERLAGRAND